MNTVILRDDPDIRTNLLPLTFTRPISLLRCGILTLRDKWARRLDARYLFDTAPYLMSKYPAPSPALPQDENTWVIASHYVADSHLADAVTALLPGERLVNADGTEIARRGATKEAEKWRDKVYDGELMSITRVYHLFEHNSRFISDDFALVTAGRRSEPVSTTVRVVGDPAQLFIEPGARVECAVINVTQGPVYVGEYAEIMEGALIRGGLAMGEHAVIHMGAKIYGPTTLGPWCKAGGELNNVIMTGYSNKGHDGFLGNAVIGEWCNLGAGTNASNLKNDYTPVKLWNYPSRRFLPTGLQFCGLIMGDHSKTGINTMLNTGTTFGVGVNFHGSGYPRNFTASFSEGSTAGMNDVPLPRFFAIAERMMARRGISLTEADRKIFEEIARLAESYK